MLRQLNSLTEAFEQRVVRGAPDECWPWLGHVSRTRGYGDLQHGRRESSVRWRAHRLSYFLSNGPIGEGLVVMHSCDDRKCVNPAHLSLGTVADNNADMVKKGRLIAWHGLKTHCKHGHEFSPENIRRGENGRRKCLTCMRLYRRPK